MGKNIIITMYRIYNDLYSIIYVKGGFTYERKIFVIVEREWVEDEDDIYVVRADSVDNALVAYAKSIIHTMVLYPDGRGENYKYDFWEQFLFHLFIIQRMDFQQQT